MKQQTCFMPCAKSTSIKADAYAQSCQHLDCSLPKQHVSLKSGQRKVLLQLAGYIVVQPLIGTRIISFTTGRFAPSPLFAGYSIFYTRNSRRP